MSKSKNPWLEKRLDNLEGKVDNLTEKVIPDMLVKITQITTEKSTEAKTIAKVQSRIYGGIALLISGVSLAVAYFKN